MKKCSCCKKVKPEGDFYRRKESRDGLMSRCKLCHNEACIRTRDKTLKANCNRDHMRRARQKEPDKFRERDREASRIRKWSPKREARYQLNLALKRGDIVKPNVCIECHNKKRLTAHHRDYSKPLEVEWLCYQCHGIRHRNIE